MDVDGWIAATPLIRAHVSAKTAQRVVAVAVVPMVAVTVWLAMASEHLERPVASALYSSYLTAAPMAIGLYWWVRRPASRFGPLLVAFGILAWFVSWESSDSPLPFDLAVLAEGPAFLLTFYLFLAFPMGRLEPAAARWLMAALAFAVGAFFLPWALFSPVIAGGGPLTRCAPNCPENVLQLGSAPGLVEVAGKAETFSILAITIAVLIVYSLRLREASGPQRRALMAVAVTSLLFLPAYFVFDFSAWILHLDQTTLDTMAWAIVGARVLLPLGFLIALLQAERFAARATQNLLARLAARPTPEQWRDTIAAVLDDDSLRLGYYDPSTSRYRESDGEFLTRPPAGAGRRWVPVDRGGRAVAAMVIDEALAEDPEFVRAAASATLLAVENGDLEGELRASRARILEASHAERRRIERDLHDSTQQRLVSLRIHLTLAGERLDRAEEQAMLERLVPTSTSPSTNCARSHMASIRRSWLRAVSARRSRPSRAIRRFAFTSQMSGAAANRRRSRRRSTSVARSVSRTWPSMPDAEPPLRFASPKATAASASALKTMAPASIAMPSRAEPASPTSLTAWRPSGDPRHRCRRRTRDVHHR